MKNYWLIPPDVFNAIDKEFHFDYDPCPYPRPDDYDGLTAEWGSMNWVNPPFNGKDGSPTAFVRKAITEQKKGKDSVVIISCKGMMAELLLAGAEYRDPPGGRRVRWLDCETKEPMPSPGQYGLFVLRGKKHGPTDSNR